MTSGGTIYIQSFVKIGLGVQKLIGWNHTEQSRQEKRSVLAAGCVQTNKHSFRTETSSDAGVSFLLH
jgi:hypothetical protein